MPTRAPLLVFGLVALAAGPTPAAGQASCTVEQDGEDVVLDVAPAPDALGGRWHERGPFRLRAVLASPDGRAPWLLVEVHARSDDDDHRLIGAQKVPAPFDTGHVEIVEPGLGRSLRYRCRPSR